MWIIPIAMSEKNLIRPCRAERIELVYTVRVRLLSNSIDFRKNKYDTMYRTKIEQDRTNRTISILMLRTEMLRLTRICCSDSDTGDQEGDESETLRASLRLTAASGSRVTARRLVVSGVQLANGLQSDRGRHNGECTSTVSDVIRGCTSGAPTPSRPHVVPRSLLLDSEGGFLSVVVDCRGLRPARTDLTQPAPRSVIVSALNPKSLSRGVAAVALRMVKGMIAGDLKSERVEAAAAAGRSPAPVSASP